MERSLKITMSTALLKTARLNSGTEELGTLKLKAK